MPLVAAFRIGDAGKRCRSAARNPCLCFSVGRSGAGALGRRALFPGVPPRELVVGNLDSVGAELFDHLRPVWAFKQLLGRLGSQEPCFAVGQDPSRMTIR